MKILKTCSVCLMPETRPRVKFDENGICGACQWHEEKKILDWVKRENILKDIIKQYKGKNVFDCLVPVSGGKDSSYVAYTMKKRYGLHVLTLTIRPDLVIGIGENNLNSFISKGYDNIKISPNPDVIKKINARGFIEQGRPFIGWQMAVQAIILKIAHLFKIGLIMYGEDGETEYGGTTEFRNKFIFGLEEIKLLLENNSWENYTQFFSDNELYWLKYPSLQDIKESNICYSHWSFFENWDSYEHEILSVNEFGLKGVSERNIGTYTKYAQNDTKLYSLHVYMMYLKFGFGRCTQDACIDIRHGRLSRDEGLKFVRQYDNEFPEQNLPDFLDYFSMTKEEFFDVLKKNSNPDLFEWNGFTPVPMFKIN